MKKIIRILIKNISKITIKLTRNHYLILTETLQKELKQKIQFQI